MNTETVYFGSGEFGNLAVHIDGLAEVLSFLRKADPELEQEVFCALKESASPVLSKARSFASRIADDGTFRNSLTIASKKAQCQVLLRSNDPAAGVKEFARPGAKTRSAKSGSALAKARLMRRSGVGVPRRAGQPRAMVPAVNGSVGEVKARIEAAIERTLRGGLGG